jgi:hypothetical protein
MEPGAAPAGGGRNVPPAPGRRRAPPGGITTPCEELADGGPLRSAGRSEGAVDPKGAASSEPKAERDEMPKARTRRRRRTLQISPDALSGWRAERRRTFGNGGAATSRADRRAIPSALRGRRKGYGLPGAAKNTGGGALAKGCLKILSERDDDASAKQPRFPSPLAGEGGSHRRQDYAVCASLTACESEARAG